MVVLPYSFVRKDRIIMGARVFKEYKKETEEAILNYEKRFGLDFPAYYFEYTLPENDFETKMIEVINQCLENGKNVLDMGILTLDDLMTQF